jgi:uncharacterized membrane protein
VAIARPGRPASNVAVSPAAAIGIGITTIVLSWLVVHTVYTLRYAKLFYVDG